MEEDLKEETASFVTMWGLQCGSRWLFGHIMPHYEAHPPFHIEQLS